MQGRVDCKHLANCRDCALENSTYVPPRGPEPSELMIIGEAPGFEEARVRKPFVGRSGMELSNYLLYASLPEDKCRIDNVIACHPPSNRDPSAEEIACCRPRLTAVIVHAQPKVIITLGAFATRALLGDVQLDQVRGRTHKPALNIMESEIDHHINPRTTIPVIIPTYHPAYALREQYTRIMAWIAEDFGVVAEMFRSGNFVPTELLDTSKCEYVLSTVPIPTTTKLVAVDTESARGKPWCISWACRIGQGNIVKAEKAESVSTALQVNGSLTILHNTLYDIPVLSQLGIHPTCYADTMQMAYLLQTEPQSLKALAQRHLGMVMRDYDDVIRDATRRNALNYLSDVVDHEWPDPEPVFEWPKGELKVRNPWNISKRVRKIIDNAVDGNANPHERWYKIKPEEGRGMVEEKLGLMRAGEVCDIPEAEAVEYSGMDADATLRLYPILHDKIVKHGLERALEIDMAIVPMICDMMRYGFQINRERLNDLTATFTQQMDGLIDSITIITGERINPKSQPQVADYLFRAGVYRHRNMSTDAEHLNAVKDRHRVIPLLLEYRKYEKLVSTYTRGLLDVADTDDRIHTQLLMSRTTTGRLASRNPNLQNIPIRTEEGNQIRYCFIASPGCKLLGADYNQIELRVAAFESQDARMLQVFHDGGDIHMETACSVFGVSAESVTPEQRRQAKTLNFGVIYGLTARGMSRRYGWTVEDCQRFIDGYFRAYPQLHEWIESTQAYARRYQHVRSSISGRWRLIPEVRAADPMIVEAGLKQAVNAPIQIGAGDILKIAMADLTPVYKDYNTRFTCRPLLQIHDELIFEVQEDRIEEVAQVMQIVMESAYDLGIPTPVDMHIGNSWGELK